MSMAMRVASHTRGDGLPHFGQATDGWLQRTCRIVHGAHRTGAPLGSTDEGPRRATTGLLPRQFRSVEMAVRFRPYYTLSRRRFTRQRQTPSLNELSGR